MPVYESNDNVPGKYEEVNYETGANREDEPSSLDDELEHAAEDLVTGDSDDPPLSEEAVEDLLAAIKLPQRKRA